MWHGQHTGSLVGLITRMQTGARCGGLFVVDAPPSAPGAWHVAIVLPRTVVGMRGMRGMGGMNERNE
jgi:hypothetical protein